MNIVFDLGGVVFNWQPDKIIESAFENEEHQQLVREKIFKHPDWLELDRGTLSKEKAIERGAMRTGLPHSVISNLFSELPQFLTPIEETLLLLSSIRNTDNNFYILSNMHLEIIEYLLRENTFWDMFEGKVFSCYVNKVKPEPEIYEHLLGEFNLDPTETVFIDDLEENLIAAAEFGIKTIQFVNADQCRQELEKLNCF